MVRRELAASSVLKLTDAASGSASPGLARNGAEEQELALDGRALCLPWLGLRRRTFAAAADGGGCGTLPRFPAFDAGSPR